MLKIDCRKNGVNKSFINLNCKLTFAQTLNGNMELSERIKELRSQHGFSRDEMAKRAGLSLRTIQRIESGDTVPRGDTLRRIAEVFTLKAEDLKDVTFERDKYFLPVLNLSALSFLLFPLLGIIVPLVIWVLKREKSTEADGKRLLNFQITWCIVLIFVYILLIFHALHIGYFLGKASIMITLIALYVINFAFILLNIFLSIKNRKAFYQPAIPFLR